LLKNAGQGNYFDELLARIRDIRSSEKVFYRKVLEIYALSIDYDPRTSITQQFFKTVQNKMHFAAHGHTAAEVIFDRANAEKDFMGLTSWRGAMLTKHEAEIAKNYLSEDEVDMLNRIVNLYLDFAELQAKSHVPMYMKDWIQKLDRFPEAVWERIAEPCRKRLSRGCQAQKPMRNTTNSASARNISYLRSKSTSSKPSKPKECVSAAKNHNRLLCAVTLRR